MKRKRTPSEPITTSTHTHTFNEPSSPNSSLKKHSPVKEYMVSPNKVNHKSEIKTESKIHDIKRKDSVVKTDIDELS